MWAKKYKHKDFYIGRLDYDSDLLEEVHKFCEENNITMGHVQILGALKKAVVGFYNQQSKKYETINLDKNLEIVNCYGNISLKDGKPFAHLHLVISDQQHNCYAGHTMPGCIVFAGEAYLHHVEGPQCIRQLDETTQLPLWKEPE